MANTFKLKTKANVGTATSDVYVVPSATTTVVIGVTLANTSGSSINVGVGVTRASTDDVKLMKMFQYLKDHHLNLWLVTKSYWKLRTL